MPGQHVPPVSVPISGSNIVNTQQRVVYQGMPPPQQIVVKEQIGQVRQEPMQYSPTRLENYTVERTSVQNKEVDSEYNKTLSKIDEQLQQSRKRFP